MRGLLFLVVVAACAHGQTTTAASTKGTLLTFPADEIDAFPAVAKATTAALIRARVAGVETSDTSKVSIEVVQLSIECTDPTVTCYEAVAKSLTATKLLFAQIEADGGKPKVTVTLFVRGAQTPRSAVHTYVNEADAVAGVDGLVAEATK